MEHITMKQAEISIKKFNEIGIPHHLGLLKNHKSNIEKCLALGDWDKVKKEEINATRVIKQLKNLMLEMDILRGKVTENDLDRFDEQTMISRKKVKEAIKEYLGKLINLKIQIIRYKSIVFLPDLQVKKATTKTNHYQTDDFHDDDRMGLENLPQIQTEFGTSEHQLRSREACLAEFENLQREVQDIQQLFFKLNENVVAQGDNVQAVEDNVSETAVHVEQAEKNLRQALTYKKAMYPLCGAILGFCVAGPVGMVTFGLKAGSLAAVGCGILGATGGAALKNKQELGPNELEHILNANNDTDPNSRPKND